MREEVFDIAVIGAGVVGCAIARRFTLDGARIVLLERGPDILQGASKANSAILHTGFDAPTGSLELACMKAGYAEYLAIRERLGLPVLETGAVVVAWTDGELARLDAILAQALGNGIDGVRRIGGAELRGRIPSLAAEARGAVLVPGEHVIDPWSAPLAYLTQAMLNGAIVRFGTALERAVLVDGVWSLGTTAGTVQTRAVVNCAGLFGDTVDDLLLGGSTFTIRPRKGQFVVFDKAASAHVPTIVLPVPTERTKGIVLAPTIFGNALVGPTAEEQEDREMAATDESTLQGLVAHAERIVPALAGMPITAAYAGLRPATETKEYRIELDAGRGVITVGGIRSTGLTAALGIASHVVGLYGELGRSHEPLADPIWPVMPNLAEHAPRDWQRPGAGVIVCHCELVTEREIAAALAAPLPAVDMAGLKRRTRAGLGRCQGFYCMARIAALTAGRFVEPVAEPMTRVAAHG